MIPTKQLVPQQQYSRRVSTAGFHCSSAKTTFPTYCLQRGFLIVHLYARWLSSSRQTNTTCL